MKLVTIGVLIVFLVLLLFVLKNLVLKAIRRRTVARHDGVLHAVSLRHPDAPNRLAKYERAAKRWYGDPRAHMSSQLLWGQYYAQEGAYEDSVAANELTIQIEKDLPTDHWRVRTDAYESLANSLSILGRFDEAHAALDGSERALRMKEGAPTGDAAIATAISMRARVTRREGHHIRSAHLLERLCLLVADQAPSEGPYRGVPQHASVDTSRDVLDAVETPLRLASALFTLGHMEQARQTEQDALAAAARDKRDLIMYQAAHRYVRDGNAHHAKRLLKSLLANAECSDNLHVLSAELVAYLDMAVDDVLPRTLNVLEQVPESTSGYPRLCRAVAYLHFEADQIDEGILLLGEPPSSTYASLLLAYSGALWRNGERDAARAQITTLEQKLVADGTALSWLQVADWHYRHGAISEAQNALKSTEKLATARPLSVASTQSRTIFMGAVLQVLGRFEEATALYEAESREGQPVMSRAMALHSLGTLHATCRRFDLAEEHLEEALAMYERHGEVAICVEKALTQLCDAQLRGTNPDAEESYEKLQRGFRGQDRTSRVYRLRVDARIASAKGAHEDALTSAQEALDEELRCFGDESPEIPDCYLLLSEVGRAAGKVENAVQAADDAVRTATALFGEHHPTTIEAYRAQSLELQEVAAGGATENTASQVVE